ncbi:hypothetical protein Tsubulata_032102 [Turnera subulata]|uniref:peptidyl-tRNA hydrolase n=1 Tax=Turnera subulata TaxID=218843 RepID=A0A9Q0FHP1_9ROSI|nr:hypothetical protein Tsubulata_032102 [Turnera subulata]
MKLGIIASSLPSSLKFRNGHWHHQHWLGGYTQFVTFPCWKRNMSQSPIHCSPSSSSPAAAAAAVESNESMAKPKQYPWLIVGLGNPGKKYHATRHNVGFMMVDAIADAEGIPMSSVSCKALFGKGVIGNVPVILAKPQTFMNISGESVRAIVSYYKIPLQQVLLIYDDLDLPFAKLRLLPKGGHGGHNGMRSVIDHLKGSRDFPRLRIGMFKFLKPPKLVVRHGSDHIHYVYAFVEPIPGIGRPPGRMDSASFVLRPFTKQERQELDFSFQQGIEAVRILLLEGINKSATFVNSAKSVEQLG